jgi:hypothetical protein
MTSSLGELTLYILSLIAVNALYLLWQRPTLRPMLSDAVIASPRYRPEPLYPPPLSAGTSLRRNASEKGRRKPRISNVSYNSSSGYEDRQHYQMERNVIPTARTSQEVIEGEAGMRLLPCSEDQMRRGGTLREL